ncbi:hypothetical protein [Streptomyces chartreusis]|uniref:hypothetical protein n=1 Tax=Streptomyces chartreusis TaxID=1969 RepID=UPI003817A58A
MTDASPQPRRLGNSVDSWQCQAAALTYADERLGRLISTPSANGDERPSPASG